MIALFSSTGYASRAAILAVLGVWLSVGWPSAPVSVAGPQEYGFLRSLEGTWSGLGRAATTQGEAPVACNVEGTIRGEARLSLRADCRTQSQSGTIGMSLYFSDMTQQFHGELTSPLDYISGQLIGRLSRGDLFLRLSAEDGSEGRLLLVGQSDGEMRLLVTTLIDGASVTVFDLPLRRAA